MADEKSTPMTSQTEHDPHSVGPKVLESNSIQSIKDGEIRDVEELDNAILRAQGHEAAMPRSFSWIAGLGLGFSITNSWVGYLSCFGQNLVYDGPQSAIFGLLVATLCQWIVTLGLSEIASAFPSSGGQYHFVFILAPEKTKRFAAFVVGWMTLIGWWIVTCSGVSLCAVSVYGMVAFWDDTFAASQWQVWLLYVGTILITVSPLFICPKWVPKITQTCLYLSVLGFFVNFILVLSVKKHVQPASFVTESGLGTSGWGAGTAWVMGITNAMYAYGGTDGAIHIAEEMHRPGRRLPQIMNLTILIGFMTAFPLMIAMMFKITDLSAITSSALPSAEAFYQATGSKKVTTFMMSWTILIYFMSLTSQWVTCGRMAWAFARDNGMPYSGLFSQINKFYDFPVNTTILAVVFCSIYGLLYVASTTAFNSIITSAVLYLNITYAVPLAIVAIRGRKKCLPNRPFNLGNWGYICNIFSPLWVVVLGVFICFPPEIPVAIGTMNYTSPILVGLFALVIIFWFTIGKKFNGPVIDMESLNAVNARG